MKSFITSRPGRHNFTNFGSVPVGHNSKGLAFDIPLQVENLGEGKSPDDNFDVEHFRRAGRRHVGGGARNVWQVLRLDKLVELARCSDWNTGDA